MPISSLLKPKSPDEITECVNDMHTYEFITKFMNVSIFGLGLRIGLRKKLAYFFIVIMKKYWNRVYWPVWIVWFGLIVSTLVMKSNKIEIPHAVAVFKLIFQWLIFFAVFPVTISLIVTLKWRKWNNEHDVTHRAHYEHQIAEMLRIRHQEERERIEAAREEAAERIRRSREETNQRIQRARLEARRRMDEAKKRIQENRLIRGNTRDLLK
jgi:dihydroneopterin aldolase